MLHPRTSTQLQARDTAIRSDRESEDSQCHELLACQICMKVPLDRTTLVAMAQALLGDAATRRRLRAAVAAVINMRRRERLAVGQLLPGVATSSLPWAPLPPLGLSSGIVACACHSASAPTTASFRYLKTSKLMSVVHTLDHLLAVGLELA